MHCAYNCWKSFTHGPNNHTHIDIHQKGTQKKERTKWIKYEKTAIASLKIRCAVFLLFTMSTRIIPKQCKYSTLFIRYFMFMSACVRVCVCCYYCSHCHLFVESVVLVTLHYAWNPVTRTRKTVRWVKQFFSLNFTEHSMVKVTHHIGTVSTAINIHVVTIQTHTHTRNLQWTFLFYCCFCDTAAPVAPAILELNFSYEQLFHVSRSRS